MKAKVLETAKHPLRLAELPDPEPGPGQLLIRVHACGVCRTDLHIVDGELTKPKLPLVPGHQIVGTVVGDAQRLGLYGFGAAAHIVTQVARHEGRRVFALTRPGDDVAQDLARMLGADWAGDTEAGPPEEVDAALVFAPAGELVPLALRAL